MVTKDRDEILYSHFGGITIKTTSEYKIVRRYENANVFSCDTKMT